MKCSACNVVVHQQCIEVLREKVKFTCKPTFRDVSLRQYREQAKTHHHWVHRRSEKGKCKQCGKVRHLQFIQNYHKQIVYTSIFIIHYTKIHKTRMSLIISNCKVKNTCI